MCMLNESFGGLSRTVILLLQPSENLWIIFLRRTQPIINILRYTCTFWTTFNTCMLYLLYYVLITRNLLSGKQEYVPLRLTDAGVLLNGPLRIKFNAISFENDIFKHENELQNVVWQMAVTISRPQGVNAKITIQKKLARFCRTLYVLSFGHENLCKNTETQRHTESPNNWQKWNCRGMFPIRNVVMYKKSTIQSLCVRGMFELWGLTFCGHE